MSTAILEDDRYSTSLEEDYDVDQDGPFYRCNVPAEPLALYRSGGYHPVHLEDIMQEDRYTIVHKLG